MDLSIIIPVYNEEKNLFPLYERLKAVLNFLGKEYEIIFIDDGSEDKSFEVLWELKSKDPGVRIIKFRRNYGQTSALDAGFRNARGEMIISMDADLQNDPQDIPRLLEALKNSDVVCGWRKTRRDPFLKRISSLIANSLRRLVLRDKIFDIGCTLRAYRREALERVKLFNGLHRFLPLLIEYEGFKVSQLAVKHSPRFSGKSKYRFSKRLLKPFLDLWAVFWMKKNWIRYEYKIV